MKNSILIKRVILVFCMISIMIIGSGCAAKKAVLENQGKTECYLDENASFCSPLLILVFKISNSLLIIKYFIPAGIFL